MYLDRKTVTLILIALTFSILARMFWIYEFSGHEEFIFNGTFMINTNDGYYYAQGARDILAGTSSALSPTHSALSQLTAFLVTLLPFSLESVMFYMPAIFGSFIVIPLVLLGKSLGKVEVGFMAALVASVSWSYYNRTIVGYYDTDFLNIVFPVVLLWSLVGYFNSKKNIFLLIVALDMIAYRWWYPQSYALEFAFFVMVLLYAYKELALLTFMLFAMMDLPLEVRLTIVGLLFIVLRLKKDLFEKYVVWLFVLAIGAFFVSGGFAPIWSKLQGYVFTSEMVTLKSELELHFFSAIQTVREAGSIEFETFATRISGSVVVFVFGVVGYIYMVFKHRVMLLALPMLALGFLALSGGLRFTIYAVPVVALGFAYFVVEFSGWLTKSKMKYVFMSVFTLLALLPNINHARDYMVPTVFKKSEVEVLAKLKNIASSKDYVAAWWDYGYPIRFYAGTKTLSDGGINGGDVNYLTSYALTMPQEQSSKMLIHAVKHGSIEEIILNNGYVSSNEFLRDINNIETPLNSEDIYIYLPYKMREIYPTIDMFSNINLMTGQRGLEPFIYRSTNFTQDGRLLTLGGNVSVDMTTATLKVGQDQALLRAITSTSYSEDKLKVKENISNIDGEYNLIFLKDYGEAWVVENSVYNSTYFQLFMLENDNKEFYEPVLLDPLVKIFKVVK